MPAPIIPWEPSNIPEELQEEFTRRKTNRSFTYIEAEKGEWDYSIGDWKSYRGPTSPWVRFCSNGKGRPEINKMGFIFFGGKDFYDGYGFNGSEGNPSIIGYVPNNSQGPHTIDNDIATSNYPVHVPAPEIEKVSVTIQNSLYRRVTVDWVCFSKKQLEYMTPYFLVPGISCVLEWGWNHYDPTSLLDLTNISGLREKFNNPYPLYTEHILKSKGNYDVIIGIITHFEWSIEGNKIKCKTEITSKDRLYAGLLTDSNVVDNKKVPEKKDQFSEPYSNLIKFIKEVLPNFRKVNAVDDINKIFEEVVEPPSPTGNNLGMYGSPLQEEAVKQKQITTYTKSKSQMPGFIDYVHAKHPDNWQEYIYGVFHGRDRKNPNSTLLDTANHDNDFDYKSENSELWLNLGLVIEAINYHSAPLTGMENKEMFRVDIDDVVIGGHPNLVSTDGKTCLIPNSAVPKYFYGLYGVSQEDRSISLSYLQTSVSEDKAATYESQMEASSYKPIIGLIRKQAISGSMEGRGGNLSDYRIKQICNPGGNIYRDNIDEVINEIRYTNSNIPNNANNKKSKKFAFPFSDNELSVLSFKKYPRIYSGYLKNIYINIELFTRLFADKSIDNYAKLTEKILSEVSKACGDFWDFRLVEGTGKNKLAKNAIATMKVVDYKFMSSINQGTVYTFDYFDADSLLLGLSFKPTISNAQAIRSMFASVNRPNKRFTLTNGNNELLDYTFEDRIMSDDENKGEEPTGKRDTSAFKDTMRQLQQIIPPDSAYQVTANNVIRRLVLPSNEILQLLLDDGDEWNNPKYTGIMPGIQATFTLQGIGGLRTFMMFLVRNLPKPYSHLDIIFRIVDVQETIEAGKWTTMITAGVIPFRDNIKNRLGVKISTS
jgi:hypothetical protein